MKLLTIVDIEKEKTQVLYSSAYAANTKWDLFGKEQNVKIEFYIETLPTGKRAIRTIDFLDTLNYPLMEPYFQVKDFLSKMIQNGEL